MPTRLDRIIEIQRLVVTRGDFGDAVESWSELDTVWAHVNQTGADEAFEDSADREEATRDARMEIRYRDDVDETMRVIYDELAWDIRGIAEFGYRDRLELLCQAEIGNQRFPFTGFTVMGGLSVDAVPEASEITIAQHGHSIRLPAVVDMYHLIWRLATEPDIAALVYASDMTNANLIGAYSKYVDMNGDDVLVAVNGEDGKVLVSNQRLTHEAETLELA